jgi:hypothetical protein
VKPRIALGRPHRQHAARRQRRLGRAQADERIDAAVLGPHQPVGPVVDVEQDRVVARAGAVGGVVDERRHVAHAERDARIVEAARGQLGHRPARPFDDLGHQLGHRARTCGPAASAARRVKPMP